MEFLQSFAFGPFDYFTFLLLISAGCFGLERWRPWRREQRAFREGFGQDVFWLIFHGHILGVLTWQASVRLGPTFGVPGYSEVSRFSEGLHLLKTPPLWVQFIVLLLTKDFLDYCVHNLLHRVPWLWSIHKVHHSIEQLDFIGNFRFHWLETTVYWFVTSLPLMALGVTSGTVWMALAVFSTVIGHLNHSNLNISWGPLRYVLNSPALHVWHHDKLLRGSAGKNFGVVFCAWDWLLGTAAMPPGQPAALGFEGIEQFPRTLAGRFFWPLSGQLSRASHPRTAKPSP